MQGWKLAIPRVGWFVYLKRRRAWDACQLQASEISIEVLVMVLQGQSHVARESDRGEVL